MATGLYCFYCSYCREKTPSVQCSVVLKLIYRGIKLCRKHQQRKFIRDYVVAELLDDSNRGILAQGGRTRRVADDHFSTNAWIASLLWKYYDSKEIEITSSTQLIPQIPWVPKKRRYPPIVAMGIVALQWTSSRCLNCGSVVSLHAGARRRPIRRAG